MTFTILSREDESSERIAKEINQALEKKGLLREEKHPDFIFFVGGDGTFLRAVQDHIDCVDQATFVGIHSGSLGFFCEYGHEDINQLIQDIPFLTSRASAYQLVELYLETSEPKTYFAVNEVRIENPFQTLVTNVFIDDKEVETFRGTGLIVSTTLGSTAYNRSLGGALIDGQVPTLQLTEMAAIQNTVYRSLGSSLVLHPNRTIRLKGDFSSAIFGFDHQLHESTTPITEVRVRLSEKKIKIVHQFRHSYVETIRKTFIQ
jgi:NAD+ kinase